jgi:predicted ATPase/DNA-binding SARP family transcriptional activator
MNQGMWQIQLFGGLKATYNDQEVARFRTQKTALLLSYLALHSHQIHPREVLVDLLWPEDDPEAARLSLRVALSSLRNQFLAVAGAPEIFTATRTEVRVHKEAFTTDVAEFQRLLTRADEVKDDAQRLELLLQAQALYQGDLVPGAYDDWIGEWRNSLSEAHLSALRAIVRLYASTKRYQPAVKYAQLCVNLDPLREESHRDLMRIYAAMGEPSAALKHFEDLVKILRAELKEAPSMATKELAEKLRHRAKPGSELKSTQVHHLAPPSASAEDVSSEFPITQFFGREQELEELEDLLETKGSRLITILGLGGTGKTRIAGELFRKLEPQFHDSIWFVSLAQCFDVESLFAALTDALQLNNIAAGHAKDAVIDCLRSLSRPTLLVLDNFEQIAAAGALVVSELLRKARELQVVVTSRTALGISGERIFPLQPLPLPVDIFTSESVRDAPAVELFADRAEAAYSEFELNDANAATVAAICERLDGIPLAIEIAASWAALLTPNQILSRIEHRFVFLVNAHVDTTTRHRSLHAVLESTYGLLSPEIQSSFQKLTVFRSGWSLEGAEAVCGPEVLPHMQALRNSAFIRSYESATDGGMRYTMLETVREFGADKLTSAEFTQARHQQLVFLASFAERLDATSRTPEYRFSVRQFDVELPNIRTVLDWIIHDKHATQADAVLALRLLNGMRRFYLSHGNSAEALPWIETILPRAKGTATAEEWAEGILTNGALQHNQANYIPAKELYTEALALFENLPPTSEGSLLAPLMLGHVSGLLGSYDEQKRYYEEALVAAERQNSAHAKASALVSIANLVAGLGDYERATELFSEGVRLLRAIGRITPLASALFGLAAQPDADPDEALEQLRECMEIYDEFGYDEHVGSSYGFMAKLHLRKGDLDSAQDSLVKCIEKRRHYYLRQEDTADNLETYAAIEKERGRYESALTLIAVAERLRNELGSQAYPSDKAKSDSLKEEVLAKLGPAAEKIWEMGSALPISEVLQQIISRPSSLS